MAKKTKPSDKELVTAFIHALPPETALVVESIRQIFLTADPRLGERIKWNNPSFYYTGELEQEDPKAYLRDFAVFHLHKGKIMLVFPSGARIADPGKLLTGDYADGRRTILFPGLEAVKAAAPALRAMAIDWLNGIA